MALIIRMQGFKDWKSGLLTTEEMLAGKVYAEPPSVRKMWEQIMARARGDWEKVTHHIHCCCEKCAPTDKERKIKVQLHSLYLESLESTHDIACCCNQCLDDMERGMQEMEGMLDCNCDSNLVSCELCYSNLAPSDCEE
jgi:hypothetical protein